MTIKKRWNRMIEQIKTKWSINDEMILRYEVGILLSLLIISVTIAWFTFNVDGTLTGLGMQTAEVKPSLIISNVQDGVEVGDDEHVTLNFANDRMTKLMPGSKGSLKLLVTAENDEVIGCNISLEEAIETYYDESLSSDLKTEIEDIILHHILFYYPEETSDSNIYAHPVTADPGYTFDLKPKETKEVVLYWIWPYSYSDIPYISDPDNEQKIKTYDIEDSKIGGCVKNIGFRFKFEARFKETP